MFDVPTALHSRDEPIPVGIIGAGQFGTKCIDQLTRIPGLRVAAITDSRPSRVKAACDEAGIPDDELTTVESSEAANSAIADGRCALLPGGVELARTDLDVILEATGEPIAGAHHAYEGLMNGSHIVMATVEADVTVGPLLADIATSRDLVYSTAYGDQAALIAELVAWARTVGLDIVAAGRGINSYNANAAIELCAAANATGLPPDVGGLHAPTVDFSNVPEKLRPKDEGGVLTETGIVEGAVSPPGEDRVPVESNADGVFIVVTTPNDEVRDFLAHKNHSGAYVSADGEYLAFFRPHHLPGSETPVSIARAAVENGTTGTPRNHVADVVASTDEPLEPGTSIQVKYPETDAPITAKLDRSDVSIEKNYLPFTLLDGAEITNQIDANEIITYEDVELKDSFLRHLRGIMESQ